MFYISSSQNICSLSLLSLFADTSAATFRLDILVTLGDPIRFTQNALAVGHLGTQLVGFWKLNPLLWNSRLFILPSCILYYWCGPV